jgi:hypothetical protein
VNIVTNKIKILLVPKHTIYGLEFRKTLNNS